MALKQLMKKPTRTTSHSKSLIDLIFTTHQQNVLTDFVCENGISDHDIIGTIRKINCKKYQPRKILTRNFRAYDKDRFK